MAPQKGQKVALKNCVTARNLSLYKAPLRNSGGTGLLPYLAPFHHHGHFSVYECPFEPAFIQKRNERERQRVKCVNQGYAKLRDHLPGQSADKRLSKVETLRAAIRYIKYLQGLVELEDGEFRYRHPSENSEFLGCGCRVESERPLLNIHLIDRQ
uniref:BHLH domain-containing protein n=1 Tax=Oryzias melastigma TaxID=30732 RepID=A0A3B3B494_ORYME